MKKFLSLLLLSLNVYAGDVAHLPDGSTRALGLKRNPQVLQALKAKAPKFLLGRAEVAVPGKLDLSALVSLPENQGNCGSCWAFGITKALRSAWMLAGEDPGRLAFNYLVNNCGPVHEWGCGGGDFDAGQNFLSSRGPWLESADPYRQSDGGRCLGTPPVATALTYKTVGPGNRPPTFQELATAMAQKHMLVVDVAVCGAWEGYSGGILSSNDCGARSINHIVNMNGYDCESSVDAAGNCVFDAGGKPKNGDGYLIVMNNWGESGWGEKDATNGHGGYMRTRWGIDAIADTAMYFEVQAPKPAPSCTVTPVKTDVQVGEAVVLTLASQNATKASYDGKDVPVSGTFSTVFQVPGFQTVQVQVTGEGGQAICETQVTVLPAPTPDPSGALPQWAVYALIALAGAAVASVLWLIARK